MCTRLRTHKIFVAEHLVDTSIPDVAASRSYNNIAIIYRKQGKYEEALELYTKSLDIETRIYGGDNHPDVAVSIKNIGIVYHNKGDRAAATEMYTKAYHIFLKVLGPDHPYTQMSSKSSRI